MSRPRRVTAFICGLVLAFVPTLARAQFGPSPIGVSEAVEEEVASGQMFVGTVVPVRTAVIGSAVDGRVVEFPIDEGNRVEAGQTLAQLLTETINLELKTAQAELKLRQEELRELKNGTRPEELRQIQADMQRAKAVLDYARSRHDRMKKLFDEGRAVSQEDLDEAVSTLESAHETYVARDAAYKLAVEGPREEQIGQAEARVLMQQAVVEKLADQVKKHTIISRFPGYVVAEHTEEGAWVNRGDPVAEVVYLDEVDVLANVLEAHVPYVRKGQEVKVEIPALPEPIVIGTVHSIVPQGDVRARTFPVKIRVKNTIDPESGPLIKSAMLARVTLPTGPVKKVVIVPKDALVLGGKSPIVYVVDVDATGEKPPKGKARAVPVEIGVAKDKWIEVRGGVQVGDRVVVLGNERLRPGADVIITRTIGRHEDIGAEATSSR